MPIRPAFKHYTPELLRRHQNALFVFGDNFAGFGTGGQASIRHAPNAIGIPTKRAPGRYAEAFLSNADAPKFSEVMDRRMRRISSHLDAGGMVFWPADGLGTGLAELPRKAPDLYAMLCSASRDLFDRYGERPLRSAIVCGGREFGRYRNDDGEWAVHQPEVDFLNANLDGFFQEALSSGVVIEVIHGNAPGADRLAQAWAQTFSQTSAVLETPVPANWDLHKKAAGFIRNSEMLTRLLARRDQIGAEVSVIAFPGGVGTEMMCDIARKAGVEPYIPVPDGTIRLKKPFEIEEVLPEQLTLGF